MTPWDSSSFVSQHKYSMLTKEMRSVLHFSKILLLFFLVTFNLQYIIQMANPPKYNTQENRIEIYQQGEQLNNSFSTHIPLQCSQPIPAGALEYGIYMNYTNNSFLTH